MTRLIIILLSLCTVIKAQLFTCDPYQDCENSTLAQFVPDPNDCHNFYVCVDKGNGLFPDDEPISCPDGQYFDQQTRSCKPETVPGICNDDPCLLPCKNTCWFSSDVIFSAEDCSKYYSCTNETATEESCSGNEPFFNGNICVSSRERCCDPCSVYCFEPGSQVVDPYDCTKFYVCVEGGSVDEQFHLSCDSGEYFDFKVGRCVEGMQCTSMCIITTTTGFDSTIIHYTTASELETSKASTTSSMDTTNTTELVTNTYTPTTSVENSTTHEPLFCVDDYICIIDGDYPRCNFCDNSYIHCEDKQPSFTHCQTGDVFNTNRCVPECVPAEECPAPQRT